MTLYDDLLDMIDGGEDCIVWPYAVNPSNGYPILRHAGEARTGHRLALVVKTGDMPAGMSALHSCDVPACVNVDHLRWGNTGRQRPR